MTISSTHFQPFKFTRNTLTLAQIAAGQGQVAFGPGGGSEIVPVGSYIGFGPLGGGYQLSMANGLWTHDSDYGYGSRHCSEVGGGTITVGDSLGAMLTISPYLTGTAGNGLPSLYRSFFIQAGFVDGDENFFGSCTEFDGSITTYESAFGAGIGGAFSNPPDTGNSLIIDSTGNQINESWVIDENSYQLNLQSQLIP